MPTRTLQRGDAAPSFNLKDQTTGNHTLEDTSGHRTVLLFLPDIYDDDTHALVEDLREHKQVFDDQGIKLLAVAVAPRGAISRLSERLEVPFDILADERGETAEAYGAWGKAHPDRTESPWGVIPRTYVIGPDQKIERTYHAIDAQTHTEEILRDLRELSAVSGR